MNKVLDELAQELRVIIGHDSMDRHQEVLFSECSRREYLPVILFLINKYINETPS